jgi:hypothetical protein
MLLTLHGESFVDVVVLLQVVKQFPPYLPPLASIHEGLGVTNHDQTITCPGKQDVQPFGCSHEPDVM